MSAKILIVNDEANVLRILGRALEAEGHRIISAETGEAALRKITSEPFDLLILDVKLPDMSGISFCRQLRARPDTAELPVILLSGRTETADKIKDWQTATDEYVTKPFDIDEMVTRVAALLERTQKLQYGQTGGLGQTLGFVGAKGGVGATTVALNVAAALCAERRSTIVAELRPSFGTCSLELGEAPTDGLASLLELESRNITTRELRRRLVKYRPGLRVLFGPRPDEGYTEVTPDHALAVVSGLADMSEYTLLDLPGDMSPGTRAAIERCDYVVVVAEHRECCWDTAKAVLERIDSWGVGKTRRGIVMVSRAASSRPPRAGDISLELGVNVIGFFPPAEDACNEAYASGVPIVLSQPGSTPAIALTEIAHKIEERVSTPVGV